MATRAVEAGAAGHGAEPRGKRTEQGEATYLVAIAEGLWEEMERDERVFLLGEDIGVYGGAFKVTEGFIERFGPQRVMDTPIVEETIVGAALGAAMEGLRPVAEFQYADFMSSGYDEITTALARYHYRSGVPVPVVLRGPSGGGVRASSFHSTNPEPWLSQAPGLKVICPAFPSDAKGLLKSAIRDDNPCVFLEHKWIYRRIKEIVSDDPDHLVPIGKADVKREGTDVSVITHGMMVHLALEAAETLATEGIAVEVLDLRTVQPLDEEAILGTVTRTSRAIVLSESQRYLSTAAEVASLIAEEAFESLDAPVVRLTPPHVPVPFSPRSRTRTCPRCPTSRTPSASSQPGERGGPMTAVKMPQLGETVIEGTILKWLKQEGDQVALDEPLFEISTDKVDTEVPSSAAGTLTKILVAEGETVAVGTELAEISEAGAAGAGAPGLRRSSLEVTPRTLRPRPRPPGRRCPSAPAPPLPPTGSAAAARPRSLCRRRWPLRRRRSSHHPIGGRSQILSPLVRKLATEHGVDLGQVAGTGTGGRITKNDVLGFVASRGDSAPAAAGATAPAPVPSPAPAVAPQPAPAVAPQPAPALSVAARRSFRSRTSASRSRST